MVTNSPAHPFLDGTVKKLFIDGQSVEAVSGCRTCRRRIGSRTRSGPGWCGNCYGVTEPTMTYEGLGMSGYGAKGGRRHIDEYLYSKTVWLKI